jgi:hypothetical protein
MRYLCSLIFILWPALSWGFGSEFYTQYQMQSTINQPVTTTSSAASQMKRTDQTYEYRAQNIGDLVSVATGVTVSQPDYSTYLVRNRLGVEKKLSDTVKSSNEFQGTALLTLAKGSHTGTIGYSGSLAETPLPMQKFDLSYEEGFYNKSTLLGAEYTYQQQEQPLSYFIDRDFKTKTRAETVNTSVVGLYYEQILTSRLKNRVKASTAHRLGERPRNYGLEDRLGYALTRRIYLQGAAAYVKEDTNEALVDERGYFTLTRGEVSATYEPIYDLLISASYALSVEQENEPRSDTQTKVGTDQYGLGVQYAYGDLKFNLKGTYYVAQLGNGTSALGGITWTF